MQQREQLIRTTKLQTKVKRERCSKVLRRSNLLRRRHIKLDVLRMATKSWLKMCYYDRVCYIFELQYVLVYKVQISTTTNLDTYNENIEKVLLKGTNNTSMAQCTVC